MTYDLEIFFNKTDNDVLDDRPVESKYKEETVIVKTSSSSVKQAKAEVLKKYENVGYIHLLNIEKSI